MREFRILVVCQANLCRSPMAEQLAGRALAGQARTRPHAVTVSSAGTHAREGLAMHPYAREALRWNGLPGGEFRSRRLRPELVTGADLVLTASRAQRAECARLAPTAIRHSFTLLQFARLAAAMPPAALAGVTDLGDRLAAVIAAVPHLRALATPQALEDDDLRDPVRGPLTGFRQCADQIRDALDRVTAVVGTR